jgi:hypothetical protein
MEKGHEDKGKARKAFERDVEQTKHDLSGGRKGTDLDQDVDDTVKQAAGKQPVPPAKVPNRDDE